MILYLYKIKEEIIVKHPFTYAVIYYYYDEHIKQDKYFREAGIGFTDSYAEAAYMLEEMYGEDLVRIINIFLMESSDLMRLPEEFINMIEDEAFEPIECDANGKPIVDKKWEKIEKFKQAVANSQSGKLNNN